MSFKFNPFTGTLDKVTDIDTDTILTGFTEGSVLFVDSSSTFAQDNANFFWDDTLDSLLLAGADGKRLIVKGNASQTANLQEWQDSVGQALASVGTTGIDVMAWRAGLSGTDPQLSLALTESAAFTAKAEFQLLTHTRQGSKSCFTFNVVPTIGGGVAKLFDVQLNSTSVFSVENSGLVNFTDDIKTPGIIESGNNTHREVTLKGNAGVTNSACRIYFGDNTNTANVVLSSKEFLSWAHLCPAGTKLGIGWWDTEPNAQVDLRCATATNIGLIVQGAAVQTANLTEWQDSAGTITSAIHAPAAGASVQVATFGSTGSATATDGDAGYITCELKDSAGAQTEFARIIFAAPTVSSAAKDGEIRFSVMDGNVFRGVFKINNTGLEVIPPSTGAQFIKLGGYSIGASESGPYYSGFFAGTPSDDVTFNLARSNASYALLGAGVDGDAYRRFLIAADGSLSWGSGSASRDVSLSRSTTDTLAFSGSLVTQPNSATDIGLIVQGAAAQSANLSEWQDSVGGVLSCMTSDGKPIVYGSSADVFQTWEIPDADSTNGTDGGKLEVVLTQTDGGSSRYHTDALFELTSAYRFNNNAFTFNIEGSTSTNNYSLFRVQDAGVTKFQVGKTGGVDFEDTVSVVGTYRGKNSASNFNIYFGQDGGSSANIGGIWAASVSAGTQMFGAFWDASYGFWLKPLLFGAVGDPGAVGIKVKPYATTDVGILVQGLASQTANLTEWQDSSAVVMLSVQADGDLEFNDGVDIVFDTTTGTKIGTATTQKLGFFGATPVVQQTEITDELTTITHTAPGTPDYALQDLIDSGVGSAFGFATKDEGNTLLSVVANLQARVNELETVLSTLGLLADAD